MRVIEHHKRIYCQMLFVTVFILISTLLLWSLSSFPAFNFSVHQLRRNGSNEKEKDVVAHNKKL